MRTISIISLVVVCSVTPPSNAGISHVWFETTSNGGQSAGSPAGALGSRLNLYCDTLAPTGSCQWDITLRISNSTGLQGWNADFATSDGNGLTASDGVLSDGNLWRGIGSWESGGTGGSGIALLRGAQGQSFADPWPLGGVHDLFTSILNRTFAPGESAEIDVFANIPVSPVGVEWWNQATATNADPINTGYEFVQFATNAPVQSFGTYPVAISEPVIRIVFAPGIVPEPSSSFWVTLLGIGLLKRNSAATRH